MESRSEPADAGSGAELGEHLRIRLHQADEVLGFKDAKGTQIGTRLREAIQLVPTGVRRVKEDGLRMPRMALDRAGSRVVAGDGYHVGFLLQQDRKRGIEILDRFDLRLEVPVFTVLVGILEVDEEEVVLRVQFQVAPELFGDGLRTLHLGHADELGQTLVHRIDRERRRPKAIPLFKGWNMGLVGDAAEEKGVRRMLLRQEGKCLLVEFRNDEISAVLERVAADHGFRMSGHRLEVHGICAACAKPPARRHHKLDMI